MEESIEEVSKALRTLGKPAAFTPDLKVSDDFLAPLFKAYYARLGLQNLMNKSDYHVLAQFTEASDIPDEVEQVLDTIVEVARLAKSSDGPSDQKNGE